VARSAEAGFDEHVAKPPDPAVLERVLSGPALAEDACDGRAAPAAAATQR
jgi:hypothetical protein